MTSFPVFYTLCLRYVCYLIIFVFLCGKIQTRESHYRTRKHIIEGGCIQQEAYGGFFCV